VNDSLNGCQSRAVTEPQREAFSFTKKEKSIRFNRRECAGGVARGRRAGGVLFLCLATEKDTKKNALEGLR